MRATLASTLLALGSIPLAQEPGYEAAFDYIGTYPSDSNPGFHQDVQGVTNDGANWYFTQELDVWKVPVDVVRVPWACAKMSCRPRSAGDWSFQRLERM